MVEPGEHFVERVFDGFAGGIAMSFEGQRHVTRVADIALDCLVKSFALDGECSGVVVAFVVNSIHLLEARRLMENRSRTFGE
jgi:hypothetical protein